MGLISEKPKFDLSDISIVPTVTSNIDHRSEECNPFIKDKNGWLPLFTAPMSSVINEKNINYFIENRINPILPRTESLETRLEYSKEYFCAFGLDEFINTFIPEDKNEVPILKHKHYILIDIANGHMRKLLHTIQWSKCLHKDNLILMVGNIANPNTYRLLSEAGADYIRCSIGSGAGCLTAVQTGVYYPNGSLISECKELKTKYNLKAKIIADGGMKSYSDIIKALAIGADYVMLGSILNKALESAGKTFDTIYENTIDQYSEKALNIFKITNGSNIFYKEFYGMSTKKAQAEMGNTTLKTSEGVIRRVQVEYTLSGWVNNFIAYMRTTMSYTGKKTLEEFIGNIDYILLTNNTINRIDK